eukprot:3246327-Pleurochrysis_carterae.AAC.1
MVMMCGRITAGTPPAPLAGQIIELGVKLTNCFGYVELVIETDAAAAELHGNARAYSTHEHVHTRAYTLTHVRARTHMHAHAHTRHRAKICPSWTCANCARQLFRVLGMQHAVCPRANWRDRR